MATRFYYTPKYAGAGCNNATKRGMMQHYILKESRQSRNKKNLAVDP